MKEKIWKKVVFPKKITVNFFETESVFGKNEFVDVSMMTPSYFNDKEYIIVYYIPEVFLEKEFGEHLKMLFNEPVIKHLVNSLYYEFLINDPYSEKYNPRKRFFLKDKNVKKKIEIHEDLIYFLRYEVYKNVFKIFPLESIETRTCLACMVRYKLGYMIDDVFGD